MPKTEIVWLIEERYFAELISLGAYFSLVRYTRGGIEYEVLVNNDEFTFFGGEGDNGDFEN